MRGRLVFAGAFRRRGVDLATGDHGRCAGDCRRANPCAEIRVVARAGTSRRKRGDFSRCDRLRRWWRGAADSPIDAAEHVAAFVVMLAGAALVGAGANLLAAEAIRSADAGSTRCRGRGAAKQRVGAAGIFRAGVAGAAAQRFIGIGAVADAVVAAFAFAAILVGPAGLTRLRSAFAGWIASGHWRHADAGIARILANAAAEVRSTVTGGLAADKAWAADPWPGWVFTGADTAHAASDAAAVIFFTAYVARRDAKRRSLAANRRIRAEA